MDTNIDNAKAPQQNKPPRKKPPTTKYIACSSSQELIRALEFSLQDTDVVAELGAQLRDASQTICKFAKKAVLVDVSRKVPHQAEQKSRAMRRPGLDELQLASHATFMEIDSLQQWRHALFGSNTNNSPSYTVFVLDVNAICGNDLEMSSLAIIQEFIALNALVTEEQQPVRLVFVKSASLAKWASRLIHVKKCKPHYDSNMTRSFPQIIACVGVDEYRTTIQHVVRPGDAILEVGCHLGTTTALLHKKASSRNTERTDGYCIGVDVGASIIKKAKERHSNVYFAIGDAWKTAELLRIQQDYFNKTDTTMDRRRLGFDAVFIDVGGLSGSDGLLEALMLLSSLSNALEPRYIVIKSLCVQRLASTLVPYWQAHKEAPLDRVDAV